MKTLRKKLIQFMNNLRIQKKLMFLYLICIIFPLIISDGVILLLLIRADEAKSQNEMQNIAEAVSYELSSVFEVADRITSNIYTNREIDEFLNTEYESVLDFYTKSRTILDSVYYDMVIGYSSTQMYLYTENDTITNGGHFQRIDSVEDLAWYQEFAQSGKNDDLLFYYDDSMRMSVNTQRKVSVIKKLDYYHSSPKLKFVKLDLDYNSINRKLEKMGFDTRVYVCSEDTILFSNSGNNKYTEPFATFSGKKIGCELGWSFYGKELRILVEEPENMVLDWLGSNLLWVLLLIALNIVLPRTVMHLINQSFVSRLEILSNAFEVVEMENPDPIREIQGTDEIASLMRNYNRMLQRQQELIRIVYKDRLERQEMDLARQNAEIQALHSQINPHFLFNVLESIRMHSVLKGEEETAEMIARLAQLERQSVKWNSDYVCISEEMQFIEAYLELQKYRFGKRLSYEIELAQNCRSYLLPRLTLATFVENACVHGIEGKQANCWVYIRVYEKEGWLYLEIEDTGSGMEEEQIKTLLEQIRSCDINTVKESNRVGILNACPRLKMIFGGMVEFQIESEPGVGCWFMIRIPTEKMKGGTQHAECDAGR